MSLVSNIQSYCGKNGISIPMLERELNFGKGSIYKWDTNSPSVDKLQKVANYFNVSTDELLLGFNRQLLVSTLAFVRNGRTLDQFAQDTGVDKDELFEICSGHIFKPPALDTIEKIAADNPISQITPIDRNELLRVAGYDPDNLPSPPPPIRNKSLPELTAKDERSIQKRLESVLNDLMPGNGALAFYDGEEPMSEEDKELLRISLENTMRLAKQMAKQKFTPKKYRK